MRTNLLDVLCGVVLIVGALNWGTVGLLEVGLLEAAMTPVFRPAALESVLRLSYVAIGVAGLYYLYPLYKMAGDYRRDDSLST